VAARKAKARAKARLAKAKAAAEARKRQAEAPAVAGVAGAATTLPDEDANASAELPSELAAVPAVENSGSAQRIRWTSLVLTGLIGLALGLAVLASMPSSQLAFLPASNWIAKRRLDLVIGGMGVLTGGICVLLINAAFGP
jgi:hypothetical protein